MGVRRHVVAFLILGIVISKDVAPQYVAEARVAVGAMAIAVKRYLLKFLLF
jgi:hypothetical protein